MLLNSFFRTNPYNPSVPDTELLYSRYLTQDDVLNPNAGLFTFTLPDYVTKIYVEMGGASGVGYSTTIVGGKGNKVSHNINIGSAKTISGRIATYQSRDDSLLNSYLGRKGFQTGGDSHGQNMGALVTYKPQGGPGSTGFSFNGINYEASSGGSASSGITHNIGSDTYGTGGKGGGNFGGAEKTPGTTRASGNNASNQEPGWVSYNNEGSFIRIYAVNRE